MHKSVGLRQKENMVMLRAGYAVVAKQQKQQKTNCIALLLIVGFRKIGCVVHLELCNLQKSSV